MGEPLFAIALANGSQLTAQRGAARRE